MPGTTEAHGGSAVELGQFGITANAVAPGFIATDMTAATAARLGMTVEDFQASVASQVPARRIGEVDDVAHAISFLASPSRPSGPGRWQDSRLLRRPRIGATARTVPARPDYLLNELGNTLLTLRPEADGTLTEVQSVSTLPSDFTGDSHLYVSNRGHDSLTVYDVGAEGRLAPRQWLQAEESGRGSSPSPTIAG